MSVADQIAASQNGMGMLAVRGLDAGYGGAQVLFGVDLDIGRGEFVTLIGRNGMGKTTTVRAIMGLVPPTSGSVSRLTAKAARSAVSKLGSQLFNRRAIDRLAKSVNPIADRGRAGFHCRPVDDQSGRNIGDPLDLDQAVGLQGLTGRHQIDDAPAQA